MRNSVILGTSIAAVSAGIIFAGYNKGVSINCLGSTVGLYSQVGLGAIMTAFSIGIAVSSCCMQRRKVSGFDPLEFGIAVSVLATSTFAMLAFNNARTFDEMFHKYC